MKLLSNKSTISVEEPPHFQISLRACTTTQYNHNNPLFHIIVPPRESLRSTPTYPIPIFSLPHPYILSFLFIRSLYPLRFNSKNFFMVNIGDNCIVTACTIDIIHRTGLDTNASGRTLSIYSARSKSGRYLESKAAAVEDLQLFPRPLRSSAKV